ncbi:hypothetical protein FRC12_014268 [Ceratobasidium sp. 428]|nr:hypothetical protein FRC12_014268 [Ceratobasidium sp. 428]
MVYHHPSDAIIGRWMPIDAVIERLVNHGCPNISSDLDLALCDQNPYSGGGFGDVHRGTLLDGTKVALKCVRLYVNKGKDYRKEFKYAARELHTWSKCRNPNVVQLLGLAEFRGKLAMVSPWMENGSVNFLDDSDDRIDRCQLCIGVTRGLAYLHETNIVHGDLKGGNVLLSNNGEAQLADFGNAVLVGSTLLFTESTSTRSGFSVRWAAPEQLEGEVAYSREADIYSLGMGIWKTILEIVSRQQPYAYIPNERAVITAILIKRQHPKRPEDTIPTNSQQGDVLWSLLESCWRWDPEDRPEAPSVVKEVSTPQSSDLDRFQTKRSLETLKRERELRKKRPWLEIDKLVQIPRAHQHLVSKAKDMLNDIEDQEDQNVDDFFMGVPVLVPKYSVGDLTDLLSEIRKLGIDAPETVQLESLGRRVSGFQQKAGRLLFELEPSRNPDDAVLL